MKHLLELRTLRLRDIWPLAQSHTARKHEPGFNPGFLTVSSTENTHKQLGHTLCLSPPSPTPAAGLKALSLSDLGPLETL